MTFAAGCAFVSVMLLAWVRRPVALRALPTPIANPLASHEVVRPLAAAVGGPLRRALRLPPSASADRCAGIGIVGAVPAVVLWPPLAVIVLSAGFGWPVLRARRDRLRLHALVVRDLPDVVDLVRLALVSSGSVLLAVRVSSGFAPGPIGDALRRTDMAVANGDRLAAALEANTMQLGAAIRPLVRTLAGSERYGVSINDRLEQLGHEARRQRRRQAETAARNVPVRMLLPLVLCILPAFGLLTLVPVLSRTIESLDLT